MTPHQQVLIATPSFWVGLAMFVVAIAACIAGRWDVGTFFLVWACWIDLKTLP